MYIELYICKAYTVKMKVFYSTPLRHNTHTVYGLECVLGQFSVQYTLSFLQCMYGYYKLTIIIIIGIYIVLIPRLRRSMSWKYQLNSPY